MVRSKNNDNVMKHGLTLSNGLYQRVLFITCLVAIVGLTGCAQIPVNGTTNAGPLLKSDTVAKLSSRAKFEAKCDRVDSIDTSVTKVYPPGSNSRRLSLGAQQHGAIQERWVVNLCGKSLPYVVMFTPDGHGGTYFSTGPDLKQ